MKKRILAVIGLAAPMVAGAVEVPNVFVSGQIATAAAVNKNFSTLASAINKLGIKTAVYTVHSDANTAAGAYAVSEVLTATCPAGTVLTGGSVSCDTDNSDITTTNYGIPLSVSMAGDSVVGACWIETLTYKAYKYGPAITVYAVCADNGSATTARSVGLADAEALNAADALRHKLQLMTEALNNAGH